MRRYKIEVTWWEHVSLVIFGMVLIGRRCSQVTYHDASDALTAGEEALKYRAKYNSVGDIYKIRWKALDSWYTWV